MASIEKRKTIQLKDFISVKGRVSCENFRALSILAIGLIPCIYIVPGLIWVLWNYARVGKHGDYNDWTQPGQIISISVPVHLIGFGLLALIFLNLCVERIRDTGAKWWVILIPIWNLKVLYFDKSERT